VVRDRHLRSRVVPTIARADAGKLTSEKDSRHVAAVLEISSFTPAIAGSAEREVDASSLFKINRDRHGIAVVRLS
jgi:hypothetical protein